MLAGQQPSHLLMRKASSSPADDRAIVASTTGILASPGNPQEQLMISAPAGGLCQGDLRRADDPLKPFTVTPGATAKYYRPSRCHVPLDPSLGSAMTASPSADIQIIGRIVGMPDKIRYSTTRDSYAGSGPTGAEHSEQLPDLASADAEITMTRLGGRRPAAGEVRGHENTKSSIYLADLGVDRQRIAPAPRKDPSIRVPRKSSKIPGRAHWAAARRACIARSEP